jgi:hypothetical protein
VESNHLVLDGHSERTMLDTPAEVVEVVGARTLCRRPQDDDEFCLRNTSGESPASHI